MREQTITIRRSDMLAFIPDEIKIKLDAEAQRLENELVSLISYSKNIRLQYGEMSVSAGDDRRRDARSPKWSKREGVLLGSLTDEETATRIFEYQLQEDDLLGGVLSMKIRSEKSNDSVIYYIKKHMDARLVQASERQIYRRVRSHFLLENTYMPDLFLVMDTAVDAGNIGRELILAYIAQWIGRRTHLLHAAAARDNLTEAERMLELYDSIGFQTPDHIPDLFPLARAIKRHFIIHVGGTNTGKTYESMKMLASAPSGIYLCPLRMLAYEGREVIRSYGVPCSFATGEEKEIDPGAKHVSETIGMLDFSRETDMAVIDECQLISGQDGSLYTNAILGVRAKTVAVCCAESGLEITKRLIELCGDTYEVIRHHRSSELKFEEEPFKGPRKHDAFIVFSRMGAYQMAQWLEERGMHPSIVYGKLPYEVKMEEARKFEEGVTDCLVATDAIAIGQNYSIERIVFRDVTKFINRREIRLDSQSVKQVAGRAGRYGRFPVGYVNTFRASDRDEIRMKLDEPDEPSSVAPLELPAFMVDLKLPLSLIYKAWTMSESGEPFVKADTTVQLFICRLIESEFPAVKRSDEYSFASLPLELRDRTQLELLRKLLSASLQPTSDEEWKSLVPDEEAIEKLLKWRPHLADLEKLCRNLDLASSFFYKLRRDDLAEYVTALKKPVPKKIAKILDMPVPDHIPGEKPKPQKGADESGQTEALADHKENRAKAKPDDYTEDTHKWYTSYIYVNVSGQTERCTGRFPGGDYSRLQSRRLPQSFGNEADYIDYTCYKAKDRVPEYCRYEPYFRYEVKLDPAFIIAERETYYLAERFLVVKCEYREPGQPRRSSSHRRGRRRRRS